MNRLGVRCTGWLPALLVLAAAGCGTTVVAVDRDPLTKQLGRSATTVQRVSTEMSDPYSVKALRTANRAEVRKSNRIISHLVNYQPAKVSLADLDDLIAHPNAAYRNALAYRARLRRYGVLLAASLIPHTLTASSSSEIKHFAEDWNRYVGFWQQANAATIELVNRGMALKDPTLRFLRQVRTAIVHTDADSYRRSVASYTDTLRKLGKGFVDPGTLGKALTGPGDKSERRAFQVLVDDANGSDDVGRLVETVRRRYPRSVFAQRFSKG